MALSIKVSLKNSQTKKAMGNINVALFFYQNSAGRIKQVQIARAKTNTSGALTMSSNTALGSFLPRVLLKAFINNKWQNLTAVPKTYTVNLLDFGTVMVNTLQIMTIGATRFVGMAAALPTTATVAEASVPKTQFVALESENKTLNLQLASLTTDKSKKLLQIGTLNSQLKKAEEEKKRETAEKNLLVTKLANIESAKKIQDKELLKIRSDLHIANDKISSAASGEKSPTVLRTTTQKTDELYTQMVEAVNKADVTTKSSGRFRIAQANMTLKVLGGEKPNEVRLIKDPQQFKEIPPGMFVDLNIGLLDYSNQIRPQTGNEEAKEAPKMPDLAGYTQLIAERKLAQLGLTATFYQQQLNKQQVQLEPNLVGQVIKQYPLKDKEVDDPKNIALFVGTYSGE